MKSKMRSFRIKEDLNEWVEKQRKETKDRFGQPLSFSAFIRWCLVRVRNKKGLK